MFCAALLASALAAAGCGPPGAPEPPAPAAPESDGARLARLLRTGSDAERRAALFFSQKKATPEALDALAAVARSAPPEEVAMAVEAIVLVGSEASRRTLLELPLPALPVPRRRIAQELALRASPDDVVERRLLEMLADPDPEIRQTASLGCKRLAKSRRETLLPGLRTVLARGSVGGRLAALSVLTSFPTEVVVPDLRAALAAGPDAVSEAAADALVALRAAEGLEPEAAPGKPGRAWAARVLARCGRAGVLDRDDPDPAVRLASRHGEQARPGPPVRQRLVLLVVVDTLRADALGAWGSPAPVSAHVDRLSREARTFEVARSQAPWTLASHVALFTSQHASALGVRDVADALPAGATTLAEALRERGHVTAGVASVPYLTAAYGLDQGFLWLETQVNQPASSVTSKAAALLRAFRSLAMDPAAPEGFFLFVHYFDPHETYTPPPAWLSLLDPAFAGGYDPMKREGLSDPELRHLRAGYDGEIGFVDEELSRLLRCARRLGFQELDLYLTADHGEELADHGRFGHGWTLYEEQLRVPLLARLRGVAPSLESLPVRLLDVPVMLLARAGARLPDAEGALPGEAGSVGFAESYFKGARLAAAVEAGEVKVIRTPERDQLFDLAADPAERRPSEPKERAALARAALDAQGPTARRAAPAAEGAAQVSPEVLDSLKSLGYVE